MKKQSPYRFATCNQYKDKAMSLKNPSTPSGTCVGIAASTKYVAAGYGGSGSVAILPTNFEDFKRTDNPPLIGAHGSALGGLAFSPFDPSKLATGAEDSSVKLWTIPEGGLTENLSAADASFSVSSPVRFIAWHPTAKNVVAVACKGGIDILNVDEGKISFQFPLSGYGKDIVACSWNYDGSLLAACGKNGVLSVFDPRTAASNILVAGNVTAPTKKTLQAFFVGGAAGDKNKGHLAVVGLNGSLRPELWLYDITDLTKTVKSVPLSFSNGFAIPMYDYDTNLIMMTMRGSNTLQILDTEEKEAGMVSACDLAKWGTDSGIKGCCLIPKLACNFNDCEVQRILVVTDRAIEQYGVQVTRKQRGFHPELFPDTADGTTFISAADYVSGKNADPATRGLSSLADDMKSLSLNKVEKKVESTPVSITASTTPTAAPTTSAITGPPMARKLEPERKAPTAEEIKAAQYKTTNKRNALDTMLKTNPYKHTSGSMPNNKELYWYKIQKDKDTYNCRNVRVNSKFFATPWKTGGGSSIYVQSLDKLGRTPDKPFCLHGHRSQVTTIDLSVLDPTLLASGAQDGVVKIYKIPEGGLTDDSLQPFTELKCLGRIVNVTFSRTVDNLLATIDTGADGHNVRLWDIANQTEGYCGFDLHTQIIQDVAFDYRSVLIATVSKDGSAKVIDPRADQVVQTFECGNCAKDPQCLFVDNDLLLVIGADKMAKRSLDLWQISTGEKLKSYPMSMDSSTMLPHYDYDTKLLFLGHYGGRIVNIFSVTSSTPYIEELNKYQSNDMTGLAWFHKSACDVKNVEVAKCLKLGREEIIPVSWTVPRKRLDYFQDDVFPESYKLESICTAKQWFNGEHKEGKMPSSVSLCPDGMTPLSEAPAEELTERQLKYKAHLLQEKEPELKSHMGHTSAEQTQNHFRSGADNMPTRNRWDAAPVASNDVDSDEWSDSD